MSKRPKSNTNTNQTEMHRLFYWWKKQTCKENLTKNFIDEKLVPLKAVSTDQDTISDDNGHCMKIMWYISNKQNTLFERGEMSHH